MEDDLAFEMQAEWQHLMSEVMNGDRPVILRSFGRAFKEPSFMALLSRSIQEWPSLGSTSSGLESLAQFSRNPGYQDADSTVLVS